MPLRSNRAGEMVGGWGKIENKDHLSPAKAEIRAELGKNCPGCLKVEFRKTNRNRTDKKRFQSLI